MSHRGRTYCFLLLQHASIAPLLLFVMLGGAICLSCRSGRTVEGPVEVEVRQVGFDHLSNSPVVILQDKNSKKTMPIWIGVAEAQAIALQLQGTMPPRPLTHDLVKIILDQVGVEIDNVLVSELRGSTYYARIHLMNGKKVLEIDSRPSDAIALALRFHRPIFVDRLLFESAPASKKEENATAKRNPEQRMGEKLFGLTVQDLTADLAEYFDRPTSEGILITDVKEKSGAGRLQRGDIIVEVNGEKVRDINELRLKIVGKKEKVFTLLIQRNGEEIYRPLSIENTIARIEEDVQ